MKIRTMMLMLFVSVLSSLAEASYNRTISVENEVSDSIANILIALPEYREIHGGSKLIVTYEGEWPLSMKGAFEYAAKIWEENLPMCIPIKITARVANLRGSDRNKPSTVKFYTREHPNIYDSSIYDSEPDTISYPISAIKSTVLQDYTCNSNHYLFSHINFHELIDAEDMTITYNKAMIDQFSFNLDEEIEDKYDFVTLALRDIAIGLGFGSSFTADNDAKVLLFPDAPLTPFENLIVKSIGTNPEQAYQNATAGTVDAYYDLYAPYPFVNGKSLQYMVPAGNSPLPLLLAYNFSKGYVMRNLYVESTPKTVHWNQVFWNTLSWKYDVATGNDSDSTEIGFGNTSEEIPYKGAFTFDFGNFNSMPEDDIAIDTASEIDIKDDEISPLSSKKITCGYCNPYSIKYFGNFGHDGYPCYALCVQLKDGTWELLDAQLDPPNTSSQTITIDVESLPLSRPDSDYARSVSGGLKYRLVKRTGSSDVGQHFEVKYFTRSYTPQVPEIEYSGIVENPEVKTYASDDYYIDVKVDIANIEGVSSVLVEHFEDEIDGDFEYSFYYPAEDFRKGYFIASLDRELTTKLIVTSYNDNGYRDSQTIVIPPLGYPEMEVSFNVRSNSVEVEGVTARQIEQKRVSYVLATPMNIGMPVTEAILAADRCVDTSSLPKGIYVLTVIRDGEVAGTTKFVK